MTVSHDEDPNHASKGTSSSAKMARPVHLLLVAVLVCVIAASSTAEIVHITDGSAMKKHLCPDEGTVKDNITLLLSKPVLHVKCRRNHWLKECFCLVENAINLSIVPSQELTAESGFKYVTVLCENNYAFVFFNVTNLSMKSIVFENCVGPVTDRAVRYINETNQFLYVGRETPND